MKWKPIATAPKDGRFILLGVASPENYYPDKGFWNEQLGKWLIYNPANSRCIGFTFEPTHWQELPAAPKA